ncbi:lmo0937 family membrane protein [Evansella sp. AB-rgal1]|uniref:lmo0937 family membrane protein n=1 Tax=Evansella sp. AB-rgal1 TaxID=3242696 RepID=UPI00359CCE20
MFGVGYTRVLALSRQVLHQNWSCNTNFFSENRGKVAYLLTRIKECRILLWFIFFVLLILWLLGLISGQVLGGYLHILLIIAVAMLLIRVIQGRRPL